MLSDVYDTLMCPPAFCLGVMMGIVEVVRKWWFWYGRSQ